MMKKCSKNTSFFVLGASDPEMSSIAKALSLCHVPFGKATHKGRFVTAANAYKADSVTRPIPEEAKIVFVECAIQGVTPNFVIDHHRPGDPGYGKPPEQFWEGSSIGQTIEFLTSDDFRERDGVDDLLRPLKNELRIVAAADHCLSHAYQGRCPGVDPAALRLWRAKSRAQRQRCKPEDVTRRVENAVLRLQTLPRILIEGHEVVNSIGAGRIRELPEACAILGVPVQYELLDRESNRMKVGILSGSPEVTSAWMASAAIELGLSDIYGDPARGFAGGYRAKRNRQAGMK